MKFKNIILFLVALILFFSMVFSGETINGLPLHMKKLSGNSIRLWVGDYISSTAVSALNTQKGIVVIDTTQCPIIDEQFRKIIAREFKRNDFVILINTHEHADHTSGNYLYSDCEIIAHENCAEGMKRSQEDLQRVIEWYKGYIPQQEKQLAEAEPGSETYNQTKESLLVNHMELKTLEKGIKMQFPTKTFKEKMKLDMGNMTLELYSMGGLHSSSDIFVLVPEEGLLFTGDVMADTWLTDTPGCLQSFGGRPGLKRDLALLLKNWNSLLERKDEIKMYIPGHWNGELSYNGFADRYHYLVTLAKEVKLAAKEGKPLEKLISDLDLNTRFPNLAGKPGFTLGFVHTNNILSLWTEITGAKSASDILSSLIENKGLETALVEFQKEFKKGSTDSKCYFLEQDFNRLGYRYLNENKNAEAVAVFELNTKMYPESWNVFDSLGEAYLKSGKKEMAMKCYKKALSMNPQKSEGEKKQHAEQIRILEELRKGMEQ
jgi:glyoxylase-like metal-dependent hydrolase (beta-lactamase superfamily II)